MAYGNVRYRASTALEAFVLNQAPRHHSDSNAPSTFTELIDWRAWASDTDSMPVYDGGSELTIYSHDRYNYAFRAWHDKIHLDLNLGFGKLDEMAVCAEHVRQMRAHQVMFNLTDEDIRALQYDVAGQVLYYYNRKEYVHDQARFVQVCFDNRSMFKVIRSGVKY